ncbi:MAG: veratrol--corrinoid protein metyltransferase [Oscillospiraceae bacterium]|nr:veratrol--corrinoid protein metyltransferase [Oscillospiraceae bacterium]
MSGLTPKENYIRVLDGKIPEYIPSFYDPYMQGIVEEMIAPVSAPDGPITTVYGVEYVGSKEIMNGAMPAPGKIILDDITKWRDVIKNPDTSHRDWEGYYKKQTDTFDRENKAVSCHGGDYFLTLVSFMGFEAALLAMYEEPEEVYALFEYVSEFYCEVERRQMMFVKPDIYSIMDDDAAMRAPFFSVDMYRKLIKPFHKKHADIALENGARVDRHDCGRSEGFIDDWLDIGVKSWNPAQVSNDLPAIKDKYTGRLTLNGCWDNTGIFATPAVDDEVLREALYTYVDTFAPGGGFVFSAMIMAAPDDPAGKAKADIIKDFYNSYARDYYK